MAPTIQWMPSANKATLFAKEATTISEIPTVKVIKKAFCAIELPFFRFEDDKLLNPADCSHKIVLRQYYLTSKL